MKTAIAITSAIEQARGDLDALRDRLADLSADRDAVVAAPCDEAEAVRRVERLIQSASASGVFARHELFSGEQQPLSPYFARTLSDNLFGVLAAIAPDQLRAAFMAHLPPGGISPDQRAARLLDLDKQIEAAAIAEELACREIENATGSMIARRADCSADIVLAPGHELQPDPETEPAKTGSSRRK